MAIPAKTIPAYIQRMLRLKPLQPTYHETCRAAGRPSGLQSCAASRCFPIRELRYAADRYRLARPIPNDQRCEEQRYCDGQGLEHRIGAGARGSVGYPSTPVCSSMAAPVPAPIATAVWLHCERHRSAYRWRIVHRSIQHRLQSKP